MSGLEVLVVVLAVVAGAVAQASSGFGITLIAAPVLVAVEPGSYTHLTLPTTPYV